MTTATISTSTMPPAFLAESLAKATRCVVCEVYLRQRGPRIVREIQQTPHRRSVIQRAVDFTVGVHRRHVAGMTIAWAA